MGLSTHWMDAVTKQTERAATARSIIESNRYMTLATADADGRPWASPVYYAPDGYHRFLWMSSPDATHSRNLAVHPGLAIVIFDSRAAVNAGQAVYLEAEATELGGGELERASRIFSLRSANDGAGRWRAQDFIAPARHRLYRATATAHYVLGVNGERVAVDPRTGLAASRA